MEERGELDERLSNPEYISGVLGIQIPLNESYPWSTSLSEQILQEHLMVESLLQSLKGYIADKTAPLRDFAWVMYKVVSVGGAWVNVFRNSIFSRIIKPLRHKLNQTLSKLKLSSIYEFIDEKFIKPALEAEGVRGLMNFAGLAVFIRLGWQKLGEIVEKLSAGEMVKDLVQDWVTKWFEEPLEKFADTVMKKVGDFAKWADAIGAIVGTVATVAKMLAPATANLVKHAERKKQGLPKLSRRSKGEIARDPETMAAATAFEEGVDLNEMSTMAGAAAELSPAKRKRKKTVVMREDDEETDNLTEKVYDYFVELGVVPAI